MSKNPRCYIEVQIGRRVGGRIVFELFADTNPKEAENFRQLCLGEEESVLTKKRLTFALSKIFKIEQGVGFWGGDIIHNNGKGGESIYGKSFKAQKHSKKHAQAGILSMCREKGELDSKFFVAFKQARYMDGKNVVIGQVCDGMEVVRAIEKVPVFPCNDIPRVTVAITGAGECTREEVIEIKKKRKMGGNMQQEAEKLMQKGKTLGPKCIKEEVVKEETEVELPETVSFASVVGEVSEVSSKERRLFALKLKMNRGKMENSKQVLEEKKREKAGAVTYYKWKQDNVKKMKKKVLMEEDGEHLLEVLGKTEVPEGKEYLMDGILVNQAQLRKKRRKLDAEEAFAYDVFNQDALFRAHEKQTDKIVFQKEEYEKQREEVSTFYNPSEAIHEFKVTQTGKERLQKAFEEKEKRKEKFSRRRMVNDDEDFHHINERNKQFNKKMDRAFKDHTVEIRQNLERGTAL